jgi:hypothetical protein
VQACSERNRSREVGSPLKQHLWWAKKRSSVLVLVRSSLLVLKHVSVYLIPGTPLGIVLLN